jgi:hypothetical protein
MSPPKGISAEKQLIKSSTIRNEIIRTHKNADRPHHKQILLKNRFIRNSKIGIYEFHFKLIRGFTLRNSMNFAVPIRSFLLFFSPHNVLECYVIITFISETPLYLCRINANNNKAPNSQTSTRHREKNEKSFQYLFVTEEKKFC